MPPCYATLAYAAASALLLRYDMMFAAMLLPLPRYFTFLRQRFDADDAAASAMPARLARYTITLTLRLH